MRKRVRGKWAIDACFAGVITSDNFRTHRLAAAASFFAHGFCYSSWASRIPQIQERLHLSEQTLGLVLFSLPLGLLVTLFFSGYLVSRFGSKRMIVWSLLAYGILLLAIGWAATLWQLVGVLFLYGLVANLGNIAINTQAIAVQARFERSIMGSFHGTWSLAGFAGAGLGMAMSALQVAPALHFGLVLCIIGLLMMYVYPRLLGEDMFSGEKTPVFVLPDARLGWLGLIAMSCLICEGAMFDWSGIYFKKVVLPPPALVSLGYVAFMGCMASGRFVSDYLVHRLGVRTTLQLAGGCIALGLYLAVLAPSLVPATLGFMLVGFGVSPVVPQVYAMAGRHPSIPAGLALAAVSSIGNFGFLFGPPGIGAIAEVSDLRWAFALVALLGIATALISRLALNQNQG